MQPENERDWPVAECMPRDGVVGTYVKYAGLQATNGSQIYHLGSIIPILLNELNLRSYYVADMDDSGSYRPFTVLALLLGPSADGKSTSAITAINHVCGFLEREEQENGHFPRRRKFEFDGTPEGIRYELANSFFDPVQQATTAFVYQEEFTSIFAKNNGSVAEFLMRLYDGRDMSEAQRQHQRAMDEGTQSHGVIVNPRVNGLFCSTHANLSYYMTKAMASGGLYGRFLIFTGEDREQPYEGDISGNERRRALKDRWRVESEYQLAQWSTFLDDHFDECQGKIEISQDAHNVYRQWHQQYQKVAKNMDDNLRAVIGRATRTAWMLGALYATTRLDHVVQPDDALAALKLVDKCFQMGSRLNNILEGNEYVRRQEAIVKAVREAKNKGMPLSKLFIAPGINGKGVKKGELHEMLETLEASNTIVRTQVKPARGRPSIVFYAPEFVPEVEPRDLSVNAVKVEAPKVPKPRGRPVGPSKARNVVLE